MENLVWRKSSKCSGGQCVEVAFDGVCFLVRDSKGPGPVLMFNDLEWAHFVAGVKAGDFDSAG